VKLHLAEVKGPVMDRLKDTAFCHELTGRVFLSTYDAWRELRGDEPSSQPPLKSSTTPVEARLSAATGE
jgi:SulP family sulfate permease